MVSFSDLWERMEQDKSTSPLMDSGDDSKILSVIRTGRDLRNGEDPSFWDDFMTLCNSSEGFADLLGVNREKIVQWPAKIKEGLQRLEKEEAESPNQRDDNVDMIPTGDNGAFTTNTDTPVG